MAYLFYVKQKKDRHRALTTERLEMTAKQNTKKVARAMHRRLSRLGRGMKALSIGKRDKPTLSTITKPR